MQASWLQNKAKTYIQSYVYIYIYTHYIPIVYTQKIKRKEYKHTTKESHQTTKEESNGRKEQRGTTKTARKQVIKWQ